ncbi:MAG: hypothetical protein KDD61_14705 [Bdellovibrionales bacterium]|nr:hypothetical protein [Bdellovibrionales bacterium]
MAFSVPICQAVEVTVRGKGYNVREEVNGTMVKKGYIAPGTVLDIPNRYRQLDDQGRVDVERTLNNWLLHASEVGEEKSKPGEFAYQGSRKALFYPVKVLNFGKGSWLSKKYLSSSGADSLADFKGEVFVALSAMQKNGRLLVTHRGIDIDGAPEPQKKKYAHEPPKTNYGGLAKPRRASPDLYQGVRSKSEPSPVAYQGTAPVMQDGETESGLCNDCRKTSSGLERLQSHLPKTLDSLSKKTDKSLKDIEYGKLRLPSRFKKSCGFPFAEFESYMDRQLSHDLDLSRLLKQVMVKESHGKCWAENPEGAKPNSIGLFQINLGSTDYLKCSPKQKQRLRSMTFQQMVANRDGSVSCLENPAINFSEAVRIFKEKESMLFGNGRRKGPFDSSKMTPDERLRMILSAYNGGQKWVMRAKQDLLEYKQKMGGGADFNKWEDLRLFYLRRALNAQEQVEMFGRYKQGRAIKYAVSNLIYAETLIPRKI